MRRHVYIFNIHQLILTSFTRPHLLLSGKQKRLKDKRTLPPGLRTSPKSALGSPRHFGLLWTFRRHGGLLALLIFGFRVIALQSLHQSGPSPLSGPQSQSCGLFCCSFSLTSCKTHSLGVRNWCSCFRSNLNHFHSKVLFCPFFFLQKKTKNKLCFRSSPSYSRASFFFPALHSPCSRSLPSGDNGGGLKPLPPPPSLLLVPWSPPLQQLPSMLNPCFPDSHYLCSLSYQHHKNYYACPHLLYNIYLGID